MRTSVRSFAVLLSVVAVFAASSIPAAAKCTRLAFSVNDYGKVEPAKDAKRLLDKYIADWTGERGISGYKTGPKSVKCELFLDFVVFDEYTCRAEATVCWGGSSPSGAAPTPVDSGIEISPPDTGASTASAPASSAPITTGAMPLKIPKSNASDGRYVSDR